MKKFILLSLIIGFIIIACLKLKDVRIQDWKFKVKRTQGPLESSYFYPECEGLVVNFGNTTADSTVVYLTLVCHYPSPRQSEIEQYEQPVGDLGAKDTTTFLILGKSHIYTEKPKSYTISRLTVTWR